MSNDLKHLKDSLRRLAKRCKDIKYTEALLMAFLMTGLLTFSQMGATSPEIKEARQSIDTSISDMKKLFKEARQENKKLLKQSNLELIQLMEQGDHVIKSPWTSWQFGMNYFYNDWQGMYKGRGDKEESRIFERGESGLSRAVKSSSGSSSKYGFTSINNLNEPVSAVPIDASVTPKSVTRAVPNFTVSGMSGGLPNFSSRIVQDPNKPVISTPSAPATFNPKNLNFVGTGMWQGNGKGVMRSGSRSAIDNYDTYTTTAPVTILTGKGTAADGTTVNGGIEWKGGTIKVVNHDGTSSDIANQSHSTSRMAFINDLEDRNANIGGEYIMYYVGGDPVNGGPSVQPARMFISYNPAALASSGYGGQPTLAGRRETVFSGKVTLHGPTAPSSDSEILIGVEHQHWDNGSRVDAWGAFTNSGTITMASGKHIVGISIDIESGGVIRDTNNETNNTGTIIINSEDSIGIDFGDYQNLILQDDIFLGDIVVNGKNNYGFRMKNITGTSIRNNYYDDVTVSGTNSSLTGGSGKKVRVAGEKNVGLAIGKSISDVANPTTKTGNLNHGILDATNPISNYLKLNVELAGDESIGILRMSDYSTNNTGDFNFTTQQIGNFSIDKATNSTLLRTDKYGIKISDDIAITGSASGTKTVGTITTKAGNTIAHANVWGDDNVLTGAASIKNVMDNQKITNNAKISTVSTIKNITGLASTAAKNTDSTNDNIINNGEIELNGSGSIGMYVGQYTRGLNNKTAANKGKIILKGTDSVNETVTTSSGATATITNDIGGNVGVYNAGTFKMNSGEIEIDGGDSVGIYTVSNSTSAIIGTSITKIIGSKGATALYATGSGASIDASTDGIDILINSSTVNQNSTKKGVGIFADNSGSINLKNSNTKIDVTGAGAGIFADNSGNINIDDVTYKYDGSGYAFYTTNNGVITAKGSAITLDGSATGFVVDGTSGTYRAGVTFDNNTGININSNDVILASVVNHNQNLKLSNFDTDIILNPLGITNYTGFGGTATDYKIAVVEGLNGNYHFNIDQALDKSLAVAAGALSSATQDQKFARNFLIQRSVIQVNNNITAVLSSSDANAIKGVVSGAAVVGLDISSTSNAISNEDTQIIVNSGTVKTDRTDTGDGAIGIFTNYGKIDVKTGAIIDVETDTANTVNDMSIGLFGVNGSEIENSGDIKVGGNKSIGILGTAYREDSLGTVIGNEFGKTDEGRIAIINKGNIDLVGDETKGIYIKNNSQNAIISAPSGITSVAQNVVTNDTNGIITLTGKKSIGIYTDEATATNKGTINLNGNLNQIGMYGVSTSGISGRDSVLLNDTSGKINIGASNIIASTDVPNIGIYTTATNLITNNGTINVGDKSFGIYAKNIKAGTTSKFNVNNSGVGIFVQGDSVVNGSLEIDSGATITVNNSTLGNEAVGVFSSGLTPVIITDNGSNMMLSDYTIGFVLKAPTTFINTNTGTVNMTKEGIYIYSDNDASNVNNLRNITATGDKNYGLYGNGTLINKATIDFKSGNGNIGMYSTGGVAINDGGVINVSKTNLANKEYGVGMATGYYNDDPTSPTYQQISNQGRIENRGTINVDTPNSMGMYAVGPSSTAINYGKIDLTAKDTIGMYLDRGAVGENWGTITSTAGLTGVKGVYLSKGSYIKNYGNITINSDDSKSADIWTDSDSKANVVEKATGTNPLTGTVQTGNDAGVKEVTPSGEKQVGGIKIMVPPVLSSGVSIVDVKTGIAVTPYNIDTDVALPTAATVNVSDLFGTRIGSINIPSIFDNTNYISSSEAGTLGMYVDTSGINYTNPINGLPNLIGLSEIDLYFGTEATDYTTAKAIQIGDNILKPYNGALTSVVTAGSTLNVTSASITWMAQPVKSSTKPLETVYLVKIPYQAFAPSGDTDTYNFLDGLEQRYGVEGLGSREHGIFQKLNNLGNGESHILAQAVDEMKGYQYSNIQQRIYGTGRMLDKEITHLTNEWATKSKESNKIKAFGMRDEYNTDTAGIIDYKSDAYGFAYVHEDETVKLGNSSGWYAGAVHNRIRFKDIGNSKENTTMLKAGVFKSTAFDHNGSLKWTISGEGYVARSNMHRKYLVVDEIFEAKSDYNSYGVAIKNEIGKEFRTSERTSIRPYGSLKLEYGRFSDIEEKSGEVRLEVQGNDYYSIRPEVGVEFKYKQPMAVKTNFVTTLGLGYENELGKVGDVGNKARVNYTTADWYNLRNEKENRKGNFKADLNIGIENQRFGVTLNAGYDTKGENIRGGIGFRAIY